MREVIILPEMLAAGIEAMDEGEKHDLDPQNMVIAIYLAMRAIEEISVMRDAGGMVH